VALINFFGIIMYHSFVYLTASLIIFSILIKPWVRSESLKFYKSFKNDLLEDYNKSFHIKR
jgi:hypothetical protein